jgi:hypothetical protein
MEKQEEEEQSEEEAEEGLEGDAKLISVMTPDGTK